MTKQDERARQRRRLQERAVELAAKNRWAEAIEVNRQIVEIEEDADAYNRLGKAYFETGQLEEARDAYQQALRLMPSNRIARKNLDRIEELLAHAGSVVAPDRSARELVDLRLFITETGRTAITTLVDVPRGPTVDALVTGEKVELRLDGRHVLVYDAEGHFIGRVEPKLTQRLSELMAGGNRYAAAIAMVDGRQIRVLIREIYQDPSQRGRVSFPGKLSEGAMRGYVTSTRFDEYGDELLDDDEAVEEADEIEEETFGGEEEELGLDEIEQDVGEDDESGEE